MVIELLGRNGVYLIDGKLIIENSDHLTLDEVNQRLV